MANSEIVQPLKVDDRIEEIERELAELKALRSSPGSLRPVKLKGILKGLQVSDAQLEAAKRSLFKHASS